MALGNILEICKGFFVTIFLGILFICFQGFEYYQACFNLSDGIYASVFYMLTGLHGCHVIIGVILLCVNF
jgi:cytochrome c oxidase subunit III